MSHRPFLRSAIQVVGDFRIGDFDRHSSKDGHGSEFELLKLIDK